MKRQKNSEGKCYFEPISKRRRGLPSETHVKREVRIGHNFD
jgi:hypothetical protein